MGCKNCEYAVHNINDEQYYFRWKNATIALIGCREHIQEILDVLREAQNKKG